MEEWKTINEFPDYEVSNLGRVKSFKRYKEGRILKCGKDRGGYLHVSLWKNKKGYTKKIHRLILENFNPIDNMEKLQCNHIDGNKENNIYPENLEWMTCSENHKHAYRIGLMSNKGENNPMFGKKGKNCPNFGKHPSEETRKKMSKKQKGENHPMFGKHHSEETKRKQSEKNKGKTQGEKNSQSKLIGKNIIEIRKLSDEGILTQKEIAEKFGVNQTTISKIKLGKRWLHIKNRRKKEQ